MQFLRTLFWAVLTAIIVIFASRNWFSVTVNLWGGLAADVRLPVLLLLAFLVGFVPLFIVYRTALWRQQRRLDAVQRTLDEERAHVSASNVSDPTLPSPPAGPQASLL